MVNAVSLLQQRPGEETRRKPEMQTAFCLCKRSSPPLQYVLLQNRGSIGLCRSSAALVTVPVNPPLTAARSHLIASAARAFCRAVFFNS